MTRISSRVLAAAASALIGFAGAGQAMADTIWVPVENWSDTEYVYDVRISPEYDDTWGPNYVGYDVLLPGYTMEVPVAVGGTCFADIKIETDWDTYEIRGVDICEAAYVVVGEGDAWVEYYESY